MIKIKLRKPRNLVTKKPGNRARAFTLVELLIYIAIIGISMTSLILFAFNISIARNKFYAAQEVQSNLREALQVMHQYIKTADDVVSPSEGNSGSSLELDVPASADNITFSLTNGVLNLTQGASTLGITSDEVNITTLNFNNLATSGERDNLQIEITIQYRDPSSQDFVFSQSARSSVSLRK